MELPKSIINLSPVEKQKLNIYLNQFVTEKRSQLMERILKNRTRHISVVLENIFQPHNASAVIRSCESFGIMDLHVIEERNRFQENSDVTIGTSKWVNTIRYDYENKKNTSVCLDMLKADGYTIVAATLTGESIALRDLEINNKTAVCFGNEETGLSDTVHDTADVHMHIPMNGFVQTLNLSVSVAIVLYELTQKIRNEKIDWSLIEKEKTDIKLNWLLNTIPKPEKHLRTFLNQM